MSIAPAPYLEACLAVLYRACISGRLLGWSGEQSGLTAAQSGELADLLDAVHNLPHLIQHWEECDEPLLRQFLAAFDEKWKASGRGDLLAVYEDVLARRHPAAGTAVRDPAKVFELRSVHGGALLSFEGRVPRDLEGYDGTTYSVRIRGPVTASMEAYDIAPHRWAEFFADLAANWRGWDGSKAHESLEGHVKITATCDRTGHVTAVVVLRGDSSGDGWRVEDSIHLEAGQLEGIASAAKQYFG